MENNNTLFRIQQAFFFVGLAALIVSFVPGASASGAAITGILSELVLVPWALIVERRQSPTASLKWIIAPALFPAGIAIGCLISLMFHR